MARKQKQIVQATVDKKLVVALTEKIRSKRSSNLGETVKDGYLYTTTTKFKSKYISKYQYRQLLGLYDFMIENPSISEDDIRRAIYKKPIEFAFLNECLRDVDGFIPELRKHGVESMAVEIARNKGALEDFAKKHL